MYEPQRPELTMVKSRISAASWEKRVQRAQKDEVIVQEILKEEEAGASRNAAIAAVLPRGKRSWAIRSIQAYKRDGLEALIDARVPRTARVSQACRQVVEVACQANPALTMDGALAILIAQKVARLPSPATLRRVLADAKRRLRSRRHGHSANAGATARAAELRDPPIPSLRRGNARSMGLPGTAPPTEDGHARNDEGMPQAPEGTPVQAGAESDVGALGEPLKVEELALAGGELLAAAEVETGGIAALTGTVVEIGRQAVEASTGHTPATDRKHRDRRGRFTMTYNRRRRRRRKEAVASYLRPAAEKAVGRVPSWPRFVREKPRTIAAKLRMLTFAWLVAPTKGWDALRSPDVSGLGALARFPYMPSTLAKFTSALAISGAGRPLLDTVGRHWHEVATARWGEAGAMAALYIDNHVKQVWSSQLTMSGKVTHLGRVMPCITTTYAHTGAGTPLVLSVQSGSAPLAPRFLDLVTAAEETLGTDVERAVIVDSEGSTFDILAAFANQERVIITPLKPSRTGALEIQYGPGSGFRPYRDGKLRRGVATLLHKTTGRSLEVGALVVRRDHRDTDTVLLTTGGGACAPRIPGQDLADLYFRRWPIQENAFKEGAAVGISQHRGNCGRIVTNVAVVAEIERLETQIERDLGPVAEAIAIADRLEREAAEREQAHQRAVAALAKHRKRLDAFVAAAPDHRKDASLAQAAIQHQQALAVAEQAERAAGKARAALEANRSRLASKGEKLREAANRRRHLESQRTIRQLDVAQDEILTATKLTAAQLISFALREYLGDSKMTPQTFVSRILPIRGRREVYADAERIVFFENPRDREATHALRTACRHLNQRNLRQADRVLRYAVEPAPRS